MVTLLKKAVKPFSIDLKAKNQNYLLQQTSLLVVSMSIALLTSLTTQFQNLTKPTLIDLGVQAEKAKLVKLSQLRLQMKLVSLKESCRLLVLPSKRKMFQTVKA